MNENCKHLTLIITRDYNDRHKTLIRCANCKIGFDSTIDDLLNDIKGFEFLESE